MISTAASAQTRWDVAGGYSYLDDPPDAVSFDGWMASAGLAMNRWLSAVADVSAHTRTATRERLEFATFAILGGARASAGIGPFTEFAQLLAGASHAGSSIDPASGEWHAALQPGGGVDYPFAKQLAIRIQIDYRTIRGGIGRPIADPRYQLRYSAALVVEQRR